MCFCSISPTHLGSFVGTSSHLQLLATRGLRKPYIPRRGLPLALPSPNDVTPYLASLQLLFHIRIPERTFMAVDAASIHRHAVEEARNPSRGRYSSCDFFTFTDHGDYCRPAALCISRVSLTLQKFRVV